MGVRKSCIIPSAMDKTVIYVDSEWESGHGESDDSEEVSFSLCGKPVVFFFVGSEYKLSV